MKTHYCQHSVLTCSDPTTYDCCDEVARYETSDLAAVHYLCKVHFDDAKLWDDFNADELEIA